MKLRCDLPTISSFKVSFPRRSGESLLTQFKGAEHACEPRCASLIARAFPNCGVTADQIANEIIEAAIHAGINVEISKPRHDVVREPAGTMQSR